LIKGKKTYYSQQTHFFQSHLIESLIVVQHLQRVQIQTGEIAYEPKKFTGIANWCYWTEAMKLGLDDNENEVEWMEAEDTLFLLYTS
jgi:acyl-coenzyme A synthetase/AMP-(fatty) acid ligase